MSPVVPLKISVQFNLRISKKGVVLRPCFLIFLMILCPTFTFCQNSKNKRPYKLIKDGFFYTYRGSVIRKNVDFEFVISKINDDRASSLIKAAKGMEYVAHGLTVGGNIMWLMPLLIIDPQEGKPRSYPSWLMNADLHCFLRVTHESHSSQFLPKAMLASLDRATLRFLGSPAT